MTSEREAYEAWSVAIADRVEHQDDCDLNGGGCSAPFSTRVVHCSEGERLAVVEEAAHQAWRTTRQTTAVTL